MNIKEKGKKKKASISRASTTVFLILFLALIFTYHIVCYFQQPFEE